MRNEQAANEALSARVQELKRHADWALRNPPLNVRVPASSRPLFRSRHEVLVTRLCAVGTLAVMAGIGLMLAYRG